MEQPPPKKTERVERLAEMPEVCRVLREKILENFESKTDGLDIERASEFMWSQNLPVSEFVFFDEEDALKLQELFGNTYTVAHVPGGTYLMELDLILIRRERDLEKFNDSTFEEGKLIHEMVHAGNSYDEYVEGEKYPLRPRSGFVLVETRKETPWGWFLEEGFADMMRGEYVGKNRKVQIPEKELEEKEKKSLYEGVSSKYVFMLPEKENALIKDGSVHIGFIQSSIAAVGLEMLCEKEPKLRQVLIESRSDIEKLREIPKLINAIKPGLYMEIQKCAYQAKEFARVQKIIKEAIENSK